MTDEELMAMARLAQRDERMSTGALYGDLADRIEALVSVNRAQVEIIEKQADTIIRINARAERLEAALRDVLAIAERNERGIATQTARAALTQKDRTETTLRNDWRSETTKTEDRCNG